jgi:RNA polymerase sigma factor (TIGR02999 family)
MSEVTRILSAVEQGDSRAAEELLPLVYDELRKLAAVRLANETPGQSLQPTALVHEAYLRLLGNEPDREWNGRGHFFAAAAEAMRRILVEAARRRGRIRHGGDHHRVELSDVPAAVPDEDLIALDEALGQLAASNPVHADLVKLRYFAGLTVPQAAAVLGISVATAERYWAFARAWLFNALNGSGENPPPG